MENVIKMLENCFLVEVAFLPTLPNWRSHGLHASPCMSLNAMYGDFYYAHFVLSRVLRNLGASFEYKNCYIANTDQRDH